MIRILVADDHTLLRQALAALLAAQEGLQVVAEASNGREALDKARAHCPDVIIMDVSMPDLNGVEATARIMEECPGVKVVGLSMHGDRAFVERMLKAGAVGYLLKSAAFQELHTAVREVMAGRCYLSPAVTGPLIERLVRGPALSAEVEQHPLTPREREVLQLLAEGLTSKDIADRLSLSVRTVENHRRQIMERLGIKSVAALTKYAIRNGLTDIDF